MRGAHDVYGPSERGNVFIVIFLALVLVGILTVAIRGGGGGKTSIDQEEMKIQVSSVLRYGTELENAVAFVLQNGASETEIGFAHADAAAEYGTIATTPEFQVFSQNGGRAEYRLMPTKFLASGTGAWEFYGTTNMPQVGSDRADLMAILPNVTGDFCAAINKELGLVGQPDDDTTGSTPDCVEGGASYRFGTAFFNAAPNGLDGTSFSKLPATQGCVTCGAAYHYVHVLMSR
jgi:hypothetical protein